MPLTLPSHKNDRLYICAPLYVVQQGSPVLGGSTTIRIPYYLFDAAATETMYAVCPAMPTDWIRASSYIWTVAIGSSSGNAVIASTIGHRDADALGSGSHQSVYGTTITAAISGTQNQVQRHFLNDLAAESHPGDLWTALIQRQGGDGADNYSGDLGIIGVELVRTA